MRRHISLLVEEVRREFIISKRYWMNPLSFAITVYCFFLIIIMMGGAMTGGAVDPKMKASALVGMIMWQLSMGCIGVLGWSFFNEAATGTLEHLYLSPMGVTRIFLARSVANFLSTLAVAAISATLAMWTTGIRLHLPPLELAVIIPLSVAGTYGFGFMLAAMTLTFKRTQQVMNLLQFVIMFFTGAVVPLQHMHWSVRVVGQSLPVTAGMEALRQVTINGARLADVTGLLTQVVVTSAIWLVAGVMVYTAADRRARLRGSIGQY